MDRKENMLMPNSDIMNLKLQAKKLNTELEKNK